MRKFFKLMYLTLNQLYSAIYNGVLRSPIALSARAKKEFYCKLHIDIIKIYLNSRNDKWAVLCLVLNHQLYLIKFKILFLKHFSKILYILVSVYILKNLLHIKINSTRISKTSVYFYEILIPQNEETAWRK